MSSKPMSMSSKKPAKIAELDLKLAEAQALFSSIGEGAIVVDTEGKISRINSCALEILGYQEEDLLGKWYPGTVIAEDVNGKKIPTIKRPITETFLTGKPVFKKLRYCKKDGSKVSVALTVSPIMLGSKPIGAIEVFRDITEEERLEHSKDEFIALASHQLRTPATAVKQYAGMLLAGYAGKLTKSQQAMAQKVYDSNERQINIVNDLLRVAQIDAGKVELIKTEVALNHLLSDVINEQITKFKQRSQKIKFKTPSKVLCAKVDHERFRMVLENLVDNASKYTKEGRSIHVILRKGTHCIEIEVRDEGVGIKESDMPKLFEKFTRFDNPLSVSVGGTGLGLYWVKRILDLHGSKILVKSVINTGTSFIIQLPNQADT